MKIKVGLAAFGMSGQIFHAPFISRNPDMELYMVLERSKDLAKKEYPEVRITRTFDEMINDKDLQLIVINTPDITHYTYAKQALEAGKHVIVEKPFSTTFLEAQELTKLAEEKDLLLAVFQNRRWDSDFLTVQKIVKESTLGRLVEFESTFPRYRNFIKPDTWKETGELGGGLVYNLGSHLIDQAVTLFGTPEAIYADVDIIREGGKVDDYFMIRFINPAKMPHLKITLKSSYLMCEAEPRFALHGTEGSFIKYGLDRQEEDLNAGLRPDYPEWGEEKKENYGLLHTVRHGESKRINIRGEKGNYGNFYSEIVEALKNKKQPSTTARNILPSMRIIEAAYKSSNKKEVVFI